MNEKPPTPGFAERVRDACAVGFIDSMGSDLRVVNAARVSFAKEHAEFGHDDEKLLDYLARNDHWTPFAHVVTTLRIDMPFWMARQWFRHTVGVARNEVSRRYVDEDPTYIFPPVIHSRPPKSLKQGAGPQHAESLYWLDEMRAEAARCDTLYRGMIADQVAPEEARMVLPLSAMTSFYETGSLAFYGRVARLRLHHHAQSMIRQLSELVIGHVAPVAPVAWAALNPTRAQEIARLRRRILTLESLEAAEAA